MKLKSGYFSTGILRLVIFGGVECVSPWISGDLPTILAILCVCQVLDRWQEDAMQNEALATRCGGASPGGADVFVLHQEGERARRRGDQRIPGMWVCSSGSRYSNRCLAVATRHHLVALFCDMNPWHA